MPLSPASFSTSNTSVSSPQTSDSDLQCDETSLDLGQTLRDLRINAEDNIPQYIMDNVDSNRMLEELPSGGSDAENLEFGMVSTAAPSEINCHN